MCICKMCLSHYIAVKKNISSELAVLRINLRRGIKIQCSALLRLCGQEEGMLLALLGDAESTLLLRHSLFLVGSRVLKFCNFPQFS